MKKTLKNLNEINPDKAFHILDEKSISKQIEGYKELPLPRIEMHLRPRQVNGHQLTKWIYGIVYKGLGGDKGDLFFLPIGDTDSTANYADSVKNKTLPFRNQLDMRIDMHTFKLPGYFICENKITEYSSTLQFIEKGQIKALWPAIHITKLSHELTR